MLITTEADNILGPHVQSFASLMSLLMINSLTVVTKVFSDTLISLLKNFVAKATHIFSAKNINVFAIFKIEILTLANNFVKF